MPYGIYLSAAGANVQNVRLETISQNLANVGTPGFKPQLAVLQARPSEAIAQGKQSPGSGTFDDIGGGVTISDTKTVFAQGPMQQTKGETDFAINDKESFFVVQRGDQQLLTRAGGFLFNPQGVLTTTNGDPVVSTSGNPIKIDPSKNFTVHHDGRIMQAGTTHVLKLVKPKEPGDLTRVGDNLYKPMAEVDDVEPSNRKLVNGFLEQSAVQPTSAMMDLIEASRLYEANLRMIQTQDQAMGGLISRILKE